MLSTEISRSCALWVVIYVDRNDAIMVHLSADIFIL